MDKQLTEADYVEWMDQLFALHKEGKVVTAGSRVFVLFEEEIYEQKWICKVDFIFTVTKNGKKRLRFGFTIVNADKNITPTANRFLVTMVLERMEDAAAVGFFDRQEVKEIHKLGDDEFCRKLVELVEKLPENIKAGGGIVAFAKAQMK